jgi:transcriptional regulator with AAA-type ATPase domain
MMRYTHSDLEPQSESEEFQHRMEIRGEESRSESCPKILLIEDEKRGNMNRMEENFNHENTRVNELSSGHQLKRRLFWFFVESFFSNRKITLKGFMKIMERNIILRALDKANGDQKKAADILGVKYTTLNEKIKRYQIRIQKLVVPEIPARVDNRV